MRPQLKSVEAMIMGQSERNPPAERRGIDLLHVGPPSVGQVAISSGKPMLRAMTNDSKPLFGITIRQPSGAKRPTGHAEPYRHEEVVANLLGFSPRLSTRSPKAARHPSTLRLASLITLRRVFSISQRLCRVQWINRL
jgi:hypothetical protein